MQDVSKYLQCTFSYVGYDKTAKECEEMMPNETLTFILQQGKRRKEKRNLLFPSIRDYSDHMHEREGGQHDVVAGDYLPTMACASVFWHGIPITTASRNLPKKRL